MLLDAATLPTGHRLSAQVAVFGSGPAGMSLANTLADRGFSVILAEGGARDFEHDSQDIYLGEIVGQSGLFDLDTARQRSLGGTSNLWGGYCRPLDAVDFLAKPAHAHTGWPITVDDLLPYRAGASEILEVQERFDDVEIGDLIFADYGFSPPVRFGDKYYESLESSERLTAVLNANFNRVSLDGNRIVSAEVRNYSGGSWQIEADFFVLCLGGIENSRMLMWANAQSGYALARSHDAIGRYWMDHPGVFSGQALLFDVRPDLFVTGASFRDEPQAFVSLSPALQERLEIGNFMFNIRTRPADRDTKGMVEDLLCVAPGLSGRLVGLTGRTLICGATIDAQLEQMPDPNNRVLFGNERDAFGVPRTALHWRHGDRDVQDYITALKAFGTEMANAEIGRVRLLDWAVDDRRPPADLVYPHYHHMGGTRMSATPETGVVDANCRVWGSENLYMGGSSVFPTGGYANPTYTIVQLALRLAEHLEDQIVNTL